MREIKFRAFLLGEPYENRMIDVNQIVWYSSKTDGINFVTEYNSDAVYDEEEIILMQFTGLLDKNGKEIYEGDVIRLNSAWDLPFTIL